MEKDILYQYASISAEIEELKEQIRETKHRITELSCDGTVRDIVHGGSGGLQTFHIEGYTHPEVRRIKMIYVSDVKLLNEHRLQLAQRKKEADKFINSVNDSMMRRILTMKFINNRSWGKIADTLGGGNTEDSVRKKCERFLEKQQKNG